MPRPPFIFDGNFALPGEVRDHCRLFEHGAYDDLVDMFREFEGEREKMEKEWVELGMWNA